MDKTIFEGTRLDVLSRSAESEVETKNPCTAGQPIARLVGINHVALEVGDVDAALAFYGKIFSFEAFRRTPDAAFITMGDQFLVLTQSETPRRDEHRHFGLVVDDRSAVRALAAAAGAAMIASRVLDFRDPWGNFVQVVEYGDIQFTKTAEVLKEMGLSGLRKTPGAIAELREKGMAPE